MAGLVGYDSSDEDEDVQEETQAQVSRSPYAFAERATLTDKILALVIV